MYMVVERKSRKKDYIDLFSALSGFERANKDEQTIYFKKIDEESVTGLLVASF
jgi:hypothetical protein